MLLTKLRTKDTLQAAADGVFRALRGDDKILEFVFRSNKGPFDLLFKGCACKSFYQLKHDRAKKKGR